MGIFRFIQIAALLVFVGIADQAKADIIMNYTPSTAALTRPYTSDGAVFKSEGFTASFGSGTNKLSIMDPATPTPRSKLFAFAGLNKFTALFSGSTATGTASSTGFYSVTGAPATGALGDLKGDPTYFNFIGVAGVAKLLGTGSTTITSSFSVLPFVTQTAGPSPATTTLAAGFATATAGSMSSIKVPFATSAVVMNSSALAVNYTLNVTASRTGGATTALASWESADFMWQLTPPEPPAGPSSPAPGPPPTGVPPGPPFKPDRLPILAPGQHRKMLPITTGRSPDNLVFQQNGQLTFSSLQPESILNPEIQAISGPTFAVGNVTGLKYISDLEVSSSGQMYALQAFGFDDGTVNKSMSGLMRIDPLSGSASDVELSRTLQVPTDMVFGRGGFGSGILISELGLDAGSTPALVGVDDSGHVSTLIPDLGISNPVDMVFAPHGFGTLEDDLFLLDVGQFSDNTMVNHSGQILRVDDQTKQMSVFLSGLNNPISLAFGTGNLLGDAASEYLFVLDQGDLDPVTGYPVGNGTLTAYDSSGKSTLLVTNIFDPSSLRASGDGNELLFAAEDVIFSLFVPEPASLLLLLVGLLTMGGLNYRQGASKRCDSKKLPQHKRGKLEK